MKPKIVIASVFAAALIGAGILAGSVMGTSNASAQTSTATSKADPTASTGDTQQTTPANPSTGAPGAWDGRGGGPMGRGGMGIGGHGEMGGPFGQGATADSATREVTETTNFIALVKSDLAYANGKMDTTDVQKWVDGADSLLASAQSANSSSKYEQAVAYARAAQQLAMVADDQMAQKLGADKLPSYSQRPQRPHMPDSSQSTTTTPTQAQASRIVAQDYERLVEQAALIKSASNPGDATNYLTDAQNAYKTAYDAYQAGNYSDAVAAARLSSQLANVAEQVLDAATAPASSDTPVTVPAPNF